MQNRIISFEKLSPELKSALNESYPDGYDHATFEFEMPTRQEIYTAIRIVLNEVAYVIKLDKRDKTVDRLDFQ
ncbi:MAG: hypothetical protein HRT74_05655 [Flavobacteriales bacterium]|nr:hypothetical protein [Flavobacteriales bacterium]